MRCVEAFQFIHDEIEHSRVLVTLMRKNGYLNWCNEFYQYHYVEYPFRVHSFFLLTDQDEIIGHIAFREALVSLHQQGSCWCMHALIDKKHRNLSNFIYLVANAQQFLENIGYKLIFAMPNQSAAAIYAKCLGWNDIGFVNFSLVSKVPSSANKSERSLYFSKTEDWWRWRLRIDNEPGHVFQTFHWNGISVSQLLYTASSSTIMPHDLNNFTQNQPICLWDHNNYTNRASWWSCRFMCKSLVDELDHSILKIENWHVDMIDSDAFYCENVQIFE